MVAELENNEHAFDVNAPGEKQVKAFSLVCQ